MADPFVRRFPAKHLDATAAKKGRFLWDRHIRGRFPKLADYAVARALASYGNADGTNCRPGLERLAADLGTSTKTVQRSMDWLAENGWITITHSGNRRLKEANVYSLSVPAPLAVELGRWPDERQWMERPARMPRHTSGHRRPVNDRITGHSEGDHWTSEAGSLDAGVQPPSQSHHEDNHHSESLTPPRADARGDDEEIDFDEQAEGIAEEVERRIGAPPSSSTMNLILGMLENGAHRKFIVNAACSREADPWGA